MAAEELFTCPDDLTLTSDGELAELSTRARTEFDRVSGLDDLSPETLSYAAALADHLDRLKVETGARTERARLAQAQSQDAASREMARLAERVNGPTEPVAPAAVVDAEAIAAAVSAAMANAFAGNTGSPAQVVQRAASLAATRQHAPVPDLPRAMLQVTTSRDLPARHLSAGADVPSMEALADAFIDAARGIPATAVGKAAPRHMVASIKNEFAHTVDERTNPMDVQRVVREITSPDKQQALLAGGGWCAPSEIKYDLFNIAEAPSGMIDLPTVGISRGGVMFPVSPAISDVFFTAGGSNAASGMGGFAFPFANTSDPWLWSEADDIATVTGSVNKPTLRVPCASFSTVRLEAYGITLTAGNLTDNAYPEQTQNFLRLLRSAYAHTINARLISLMVTASTAFSGMPGSNAISAFNGILDGAELAATDYRNKFGMADDAVLEVVLPRWILAAVRADLAWRVYGDSSILSVSDAQIRGYFADRGLRPQFVSDWQVRGSGQFGANVTTKVTWGTTCDFLIYAAGTFLHGTGLTLDLGVVRDSVLNAENDFTAAWAEEAHLIAKVGHESRKYTVTFGVNGSGVVGYASGAIPQL
jgi:hypothetical protein